MNVGMQEEEKGVGEEAQWRVALDVARDEFEDLFRCIRSVLISVNEEGRVHRWSEAAAKCFGIEVGCALGAEFAALPIDWDWNAVTHAANMCREAGLPVQVEEIEYRVGTGGPRLMGLTFTPAKRGGYLIYGADVTSRRYEERMLMERERFYRSIVDSIQDVIFETDAQGYWTFLNPAFERFVDITSNESTGRWAFERVQGPDRIGVFRHLLPVISGTRKSTRFQVRYVRPDLSMGWAEVYVEGQRDEDDRFVGTFGTLREISERKRNEDLEKRLSTQLLRATEDRVKTIIESAPLLVFSLDRDATLTFIDGRALRTLGLSSEELEGTSMFEFAKDRSDVEEAIKRALAGEPASIELHIGDVCLDLRYAPVFDEQGNPNGATGVGIDITESKRLENQLVHARRMESIGHLAAGLAHEVNTPTQYIADNARFILDSFTPIAETLRYARATFAAEGGRPAEEFQRRWSREDVEFLLDEIPAALRQSLDGLDRVAQIVKSMKQFSHPGTRDRQLSNINEQIESTLIVSRNEWKYVATVETQLDPNLPMVNCLPAELNQVLLNIIVNASHSIGDCVAEGKYEQGKITIATRADADTVEIMIGDDACGIPKEIREKIFDPFFTTKDPGKGTGQGLALAQSVVVDHHGGQITLESEFGIGTTFVIRIPIGWDDKMPNIQREAA